MVALARRRFARLGLHRCPLQRHAAGGDDGVAKRHLEADRGVGSLDVVRRRLFDLVTAAVADRVSRAQEVRLAPDQAGRVAGFRYVAIDTKTLPAAEHVAVLPCGPSARPERRVVAYAETDGTKLPLLDRHRHRQRPVRLDSATVLDSHLREEPGRVHLPPAPIDLGRVVRVPVLPRQTIADVALVDIRKPLVRDRAEGRGRAGVEA